ncbi:MAG: TonB-dependent receptor [Bacteroidetes bacterium]|nr:MAG: TonB-dependent receptor [Bacteroidota bacterium]
MEYGTNALAGVINLITRQRASLGLSVHAGLREGTLGGGPSLYEGFHTQDLGLDWRGEKQQLSLSGTRNYFGGSRAEAGLRPQSLAPKLQWQGRAAYRIQGEKASLAVQSLWFEEELRRRGGVTGVYVPRARDEVYHTRRHQQQLTLAWRPAEAHAFNWQIAWAGFDRNLEVFNHNLNSLEQSLLPAEGRRESLWTLNSRATWDWALLPERLSWQAGLDAQHEEMQGDKILNQQQQLGDYALFTSLEYRPHPRLMLRPGLRAAYNTRYRAPLSPAMLLRWQLRPSTTIRLSYARGFRAPSLKELFLDFVDVNHEIRGNADLRAERGHYLQLSGQWQALKGLHLWKVEGGAFYNDIQEKIELLLTGTSAAAASYFNVARLQAAGLDAQASWQWGGWKWQVGGILQGRAQHPGGEESPLRDITGSVTVQGSWHWQATGLRAALFYKYHGAVTGFQAQSETELPELVAVRMAPYHLADVTLSRRWGGLDFSLGVQNLFHVTAVNALQQGGVHQAGSGQAQVGLGRSFFLRINWQFLQQNPQ